MAQATEFDPSSAEKELMLRALRVEKQYYDPKINRKDIIWTKRRIKDFIDASPLDSCAYIWDLLSTPTKDAWGIAGAYCGLTGWELFVQDTTYRIVNDLVGIASPRSKHQYKVMMCDMGSGNYPLSISQYHEPEYTLKTKNVGQKNAYTWLDIEEDITAPLTVSFNYSADLVEVGPTLSHYIDVWFQGKKDGATASDSFQENLKIDTGWITFSKNFTPDLDTITRYRVEIYIFKYTGIIMFDNFSFEHDGEDWAIDKYCNDVREEKYTHAGYKYPAWKTGAFPDPMIHNSVYI